MNNYCIKAFLLVLILSINKRRTLASDIVVVFNSGKLGGQLNLTVVEKYFEKIRKTSSAGNLRFNYVDLNTRFCDIQKFLTLLFSSQFELLVLIDDCSCAKQFSRFVRLLKKTFVSNCEDAMLTVSQYWYIGVLSIIIRTRVLILMTLDTFPRVKSLILSPCWYYWAFMLAI